MHALSGCHLAVTWSTNNCEHQYNNDNQVIAKLMNKSKLVCQDDRIPKTEFGFRKNNPGWMKDW